eukprot:scaffold243338_cov31-Tisochrysis_lutea.AAC.5
MSRRMSGRCRSPARRLPPWTRHGLRAAGQLALKNYSYTTSLNYGHYGACRDRVRTVWGPSPKAPPMVEIRVRAAGQLALNNYSYTTSWNYGLWAIALTPRPLSPLCPTGGASSRRRRLVQELSRLSPLIQPVQTPPA